MSADVYRRALKEESQELAALETAPYSRSTELSQGSVQDVSTVRRPTVLPGPGHRVVKNREPWWLRFGGVRPYLVVGDAVAFGIATVIMLTPMPVHLLTLAIYVLVFAVAGLYRSRLTLSVVNDLPAIVAAVVAGFALETTLFTIAAEGQARPLHLAQGVSFLVIVLLARWFAYTVVRTARRQGMVHHRTVILGTDSVGRRIAQTLLEHREYGLHPVGFVESRPALVGESNAPLPVLGDYEHLDRVIRKHAIRDVVVAFGRVNESTLVDVLTTCDRLNVEVFTVPRLLDLHKTNRHMDEIWGIPVARRRAPYRSLQWRAKRCIDLVGSSAAIIALAPVLALCALAVRLEGGPGIIFRQERVGRNGKLFNLYKFRSLKPVDDNESQTQWNIKHDDRLGPVGRFLRRSSLDELPQLFNILRGDMSLVGPRPERPHFVRQFSVDIPRYAARVRVPAGLTGWSQVHGLRGDTSIQDRARFDNHYIENWSLWLDVKVLLKTVGQVLRRQGG